MLRHLTSYQVQEYGLSRRLIGEKSLILLQKLLIGEKIWSSYLQNFNRREKRFIKL